MVTNQILSKWKHYKLKNKNCHWKPPPRARWVWWYFWFVCFFFYPKLNSAMMKNSRLMALEYETLYCKENTTGGTRTACLCLISFPAPVLGRPPLQRRTPPWSLRPACKEESSFASAFCSMGSPQENRLRLFAYFMMPWANRLLISRDPGWILIGNTG